MKKWQKFLFAQIPIALIILIGAVIPEKNKEPQVPYHLFFEFEKNEYNVNDLVTGEKIGNIILKKENNSYYIDLNSKPTSGILKGSVIESKYDYQELKLINFHLEKYINKNLEYISGEINDLYSVIIFNLDNNDYRNFYQSNSKKRYLFFIVKNSYFNFFTNDESVYDLYTSFGIGDDTKYAVILE